MSEPFEPQESIGRKLVSGGIFVILLIGIGLLMFGPGGGGGFSPSEVRRGIERYRTETAKKMAEDHARMQAMLAEMRGIRDTLMDEAGVDVDLDMILDDTELTSREDAALPVDPSMPIHEIYNASRATEQDMITVYREFLAAKVVKLQPIKTYDEAYEDSETPRPGRPDLDPDVLYRDITTIEPGGGRDEFIAEVKTSVIETREMLDNAKKLLAFTKKSQKEAGDGIDVDLSADDISFIGYNGEELMPEEIDYTHQGDIGHFDARPGRKLTTGQNATEWLYVDSWYIIGPFPSDKRREKLDVRFGPEANVNLDDVFTGKSDKKISWQYKKVGYTDAAEGTRASWKIEPRRAETDSIYYAFTEIYSDVPREVWIATGTDDYGKLWVNDDLVWKSPKDRKPYNATENVQPLQLKQGQNKILYRVENAGGTMGFSLMIRLAE